MIGRLRRSRITRYVSSVFVIAALSVVVVGSAYAQPPSPLYNICDDRGRGKCLWAQGRQLSAPKNGSKILLKKHKPTYQNRFFAKYIGKVTATSHKDWPFTAGKGLNAKPAIKGDGVFQFIYAPGETATSQCVGADGLSGSAVRIEKYSSKTYWVHFSHTWISVGATNRGGDSRLLVLTADGSHTVVSPYTYSLAQQFYRNRI